MTIWIITEERSSDERVVGVATEEEIAARFCADHPHHRLVVHQWQADTFDALALSPGESRR